MNHQCVIGMLHKSDYSELVTLSDLQQEISNTLEYNQYLKDKHMFINALSKKEYTIQDYADFRRSTNLTRFKFCPVCGSEINWKQIKKCSS